MSERNVRASESRENIRDEESRPQTAWTPPALLDAPEPRDGYVQRWVATSVQGKDTPDNVFKRMRAGWSARSADTVKDKRFPTINHGEWTGCIGIEGMLLCEMPEDKFKSMKEYYNGKSLQQNQSISGELDAVSRTGGIAIHQDRKSSTSRGRDVTVMDDN